MVFNNRPTSIVGKMIQSNDVRGHKWIIVRKTVPSGIVTDKMGLNIVK